MHRNFVGCMMLFIFLGVTACGQQNTELLNDRDSITTQQQEISDAEAEKNSETDNVNHGADQTLESGSADDYEDGIGVDIMQIKITADGKTFSAKLYKNETTEALMKKLPMTINMSELNGNEKYYYFSDSLPADAKKPSKIEAGDIMLYGDDCLVLFYKSFSTSYSYTSLGYVEDVDGFAKALGSGSVKVTFE